MIVAWVALGLAVVGISAGLWFSDQVTQFQEQALGLIDEIRRHLGQSDDEYVPLNEEQKRELRVTWGQVACTHCGFLHPGLCPRVKEMRYLPNGNPERIIFWGDGEWAVPKGAHSYREVFGDVVPQAEEKA